MFTGTQFDHKKWRESVPASVFLNHFFAVASHINNSARKYDLKSIPYFQKIQKNPNCDLDRVKKVLWNSWSTEYALRLTGIQDVKDNYRYSLHWNFPQAYYSVYLNMHAFYIAKGIDERSHDQLIKSFSNHVVSNKYPPCISFNLKGSTELNQFSNLNVVGRKKVLANIYHPQDAENQIGAFLRSTREKMAEDRKEKRQKSPAALKTAEGIPLKSFRKEHWDIVYAGIHETTILDLLYRLRIKSNYEDIQTFINADIDFKKLHESLCDVVSYLNIIHEAYLAKCIGYKKYAEFVNDFPCTFSPNIVKGRFDNIILPILK